MQTDVAIAETRGVVDQISRRVFELGKPSNAPLFKLVSRFFAKHFDRFLHEVVLREQQASLKELQNTLWEENLLKREKEFEELVLKTNQSFQSREDELIAQSDKVRKIIRQTKGQIEDLVDQSTRAQATLDLLNGEVVSKRSIVNKLASDHEELTRQLDSGRAELLRREASIVEAKSAEARLETLTRQSDELLRSSALIRAEIERLAEIRDTLETEQGYKVTIRTEAEKREAKAIKKKANPPKVVASFYEVTREGGLSQIPDVISVTKEQLETFIDHRGYVIQSKWDVFKERVEALCLLKKADITLMFGNCVSVDVTYYDKGKPCLFMFADQTLERVRNGGLSKEEIRVQSEANRLSKILLSRQPNIQSTTNRSLT